jgi:hypothetical protein
MPKGLDEATIKEIQKRAHEGMKASQIAEELSLSYSCVYRQMGKAKKAGKTKSGPKGIVRANGGVFPLGVEIVLKKWNDEADAVFAGLPLEKKCELLRTLG